MFEMLTGRVPFNGETTVAIAIKHIQEPMPSPREYIPEIPISVEQIVFKCTQKSPDRRYQSMPEVVADLKQSLMHPDEDFVKMADPDEEAATRMISEQDMLQIKKQSKKRDSMDEELRVRTNDEALRPVKKKRPKNIDEKPRMVRQELIEEEDDDDNSGMDKVTTILAIIAAILFCAVVILIAGKKMGLFGFGNTVPEGTIIEESITQQTTPQTPITDEGEDESLVEVPDVTNLSYAEAVATLNKKGFKVVKEESESSTVRKGNVVSQVTAAGESAKLGTSVTVYVSISSSVGKVTVPNLIGLSEEAFSICGRDKNIYITGNSSRGVLYGVYYFLETF
jgi:serine/threonine-protein kinase